MRKLISLEIKKFKLFSSWKSVTIANLVMMALLCMVYFVEKSEGVNDYESYGTAFVMFGSIIRPTFIIFAAVLISRLIIDEYKSKSITLLFMYPIKRKKIMVAKLIIVAVFTFSMVVLSNLLFGSVFYLVDSYFHITTKALTAEVLKAGLISMLISAVASAGIGLIPMFFGMKKKSVPATIVSAIVMVSLTNSTVENVNMYSFIVIPIALAMVGFLIAFFSFRNIENVDIN